MGRGDIVEFKNVFEGRSCLDDFFMVFFGLYLKLFRKRGLKEEY